MPTCFRGHTFSGWSCPTCDTIDALDREREAGERAAKSAAKEAREAVRRDEALIEEQREAAERESEVREEEANFRAWQAEEQADRLEEINRSALAEQRRIAEQTTEAQRRIAAEATEAQRRITASAWQIEAQSKIDRADSLLKAGLIHDALLLLKDATRQDPGNFDGHLKACEAALMEGLTDLTGEELMKSVRLVTSEYSPSRFEAVTSLIIRCPKGADSAVMRESLALLDAVSQQNPHLDQYRRLAAASLVCGCKDIALRVLGRYFQVLSSEYERSWMETLFSFLAEYRQLLPGEIGGLVASLVRAETFAVRWEASGEPSGATYDPSDPLYGDYIELCRFSGPIEALAPLRAAGFDAAADDLACQVIRLGAQPAIRRDPDYWRTTLTLLRRDHFEGQVMQEFQECLTAAIPDLAGASLQNLKPLKGLLSELAETTSGMFSGVVCELVGQVIALGSKTPSRLNPRYWRATETLIKEYNLHVQLGEVLQDALTAATPDLEASARNEIALVSKRVEEAEEWAPQASESTTLLAEVREELHGARASNGAGTRFGYLDALEHSNIAKRLVDEYIQKRKHEISEVIQGANAEYMRIRGLMPELSPEIDPSVHEVYGLVNDALLARTDDRESLLRAERQAKEATAKCHDTRAAEERIRVARKAAAEAGERSKKRLEVLFVGFWYMVGLGVLGWLVLGMGACVYRIEAGYRTINEPLHAWGTVAPWGFAVGAFAAILITLNRLARIDA